MNEPAVRERALVNLPPGVSAVLRTRAKANYRTVVQEAVMLIERAIEAETASGPNRQTQP